MAIPRRAADGLGIHDRIVCLSGYCTAGRRGRYLCHAQACAGRLAAGGPALCRRVVERGRNRREHGTRPGNQDPFLQDQPSGHPGTAGFLPDLQHVVHAANISDAGPAMAVALADPCPGRDRCRHERRTSPFLARGTAHRVAIRPGVSLRARAAILALYRLSLSHDRRRHGNPGAGCRQEPGPLPSPGCDCPRRRGDPLAGQCPLPLRRQSPSRL